VPAIADGFDEVCDLMRCGLDGGVGLSVHLLGVQGRHEAFTLRVVVRLPGRLMLTAVYFDYVEWLEAQKIKLSL
jgi:hypothetical protein